MGTKNCNVLKKLHNFKNFKHSISFIILPYLFLTYNDCSLGKLWVVDDDVLEVQGDGVGRPKDSNAHDVAKFFKHVCHTLKDTTN